MPIKSITNCFPRVDVCGKQGRKGKWEVVCTKLPPQNVSQVDYKSIRVNHKWDGW
jgi:hypothetical protein